MGAVLAVFEKAEDFALGGKSEEMGSTWVVTSTWFVR